uniref:Nidogen-like protein n=1 Tax=Parastrongyloides trichosuri TaxID=131310 RepID=A0A0N4ZRM0_PARTI
MFSPLILQILVLLFSIINIYSFDEILKYGLSDGDQKIEFNTNPSAIALETPIFYYGNTYNDIYIHSEGGVSFNGPITDSDFVTNDKAAILIAYGKFNHGDTYFRQIKHPNEVTKALEKIVQSKFVFEENFTPVGAIIITWENVGLERDIGNTFQLVLLSNSTNTYTFINYKNTDVIRGKDGKFIQFAFMNYDGQNENMVQANSEDLTNLPMQSNIGSSGKFAFRVSTVVEDPRISALEEEYQYDEDIDIESSEDGCPENKYGDKCPEGCSYITDSKKCSMCLCSTPQTTENNHIDDNIQDIISSNDKLFEAETELLPLPKDEDEENIDKNMIDNGIPNYPIQHHNPLLSNPQYGSETNSIVEDVISSVEENDDQQELPYISNPIEYSRDNKGVCAHKEQSEMICSRDGNCIDYAEGYCCECKENYYGNGKYCISSTEAIRVTGKFYGAVNGKNLEGAELHTFVQAGGGTTYTAVSNLPPSIRNSFLLLNPLSSIIGWMFARTSNDGETYNGFMLTGGVFNRTVNIRIGDRYAVIINQRFTGSNENNDVDSEIYIRGTLPEFEDNVVITYEPFTEEYRRDSPGNVRSFGTVDVNIKNAPEGENQNWKIITDQQIQYIECLNKEFTRPKIISVNAQRVTANYNPNERIARYSSVSMATSGPITAHVSDYARDACAPGHHICTQEHMKCLAVDNSYRCICIDGYETRHDTSSTTGFSCVKEKRSELTQNLPTLEEGCTTHSQCHKWGECVFGRDGKPGYCKCRGWYVGDGVTHCGPPERKEEKLKNNCGQYNCDKNADCMPAPGGKGTECVCKAGFYGNGITCQSMDPEVESEPTKLNVESSIANDIICRSHDECGEFGSCSYSLSLGYYRCECQSGYTGDGITCTPSPTQYHQQNRPSHHNSKACEIELGCHEMARCVFDAENNRKICECVSGYDGDGRNCHLYKPEPLPKYTSEEREEINYSDNQDNNINPQSINFDNEERDPVSRCSDSADCSQDEHCVINDIYGYHTCMCLPGYRRDQNGNCRSADTCLPSEQNSCPENAHCIFSHQTQAYDCQCIQGYKHDGRNCVPQRTEKITCDKDYRICHANAQCVHNRETNMYTCTCNPGFSGDGFKECIKQETSLCHDCSINARCVQSLLTSGWSCQCNPGYVGNGRVCQPSTSCLEDRSICHVNAECVPGQHGHYVCNCHYGYHGNGRICVPDSTERRDGELLIGSGMTIFQRTRDPETLGKQLVVIPRQLIVGIGFDCQTEKIYWSDSAGHVIRYSSMNGTDVNIMFEEQLRSPEGIAIDWSSRNIYYADSGKREIGVVSIDGKYHKTLLNKGIVHPRAVAIDMINHKLYYSDWNRMNPFIGRMNLDGSNNEIFINTDIAVPNGITVLPLRHEICWVDAGLQTLSCASIHNPRQRRVVHTQLDYPFGLTVYNDEKFYWTGWKDNKIHSVSIYGDNREDFPISVINSRSKLYGITTIPKKCEGSVTICGHDNGGCPYLCLPGDRNVATCVCPDNVEGLEGC